MKIHLIFGIPPILHLESTSQYQLSVSGSLGLPSLYHNHKRNTLTIEIASWTPKLHNARREWKNNGSCHSFARLKSRLLAYWPVSENFTVRVRVRSQNAEKIIRKSSPLEILDSMHSDDQIMAVEKTFLDPIAGDLPKPKPTKVWYA